MKRSLADADLRNPDTPPVKGRPGKACRRCQMRKVRCDSAKVGAPCSNCTSRETECLPSEDQRRGKKSPALKNSGNGLVVLPRTELDDGDGYSHTSISGKESFPQQTVEIDNRQTAGLILPDYISPLSTSISPEDRKYLQRKGAFLIPDTELRDEFLRCFAQFVHPYLPILDLEEFLLKIEHQDSTATIGLLLFQAVMFAATAYVSMSTLTALGYQTRREARETFFQRARLLYEFNCEFERVTVVQSLLLMTTWHGGPGDHKSAGYYLGVAVSLARTIDGGRRTDSMSTLKRNKLWKRIWWCCYTRDRVIAISTQQAPRIKEAEFHLPMLELEDFDTSPLTMDLGRMLRNCPSVAKQSNRVILARMCIALAHLCRQFSTDILTYHRPKDATAHEDTSDIIRRGSELENWYNQLSQQLRLVSTPSDSTEEQPHKKGAEIIQLHQTLLAGLYLMGCSSLYRRQQMSFNPVEPESKHLFESRAREAAIEITEMYRDLLEQKMICFLPEFSVTTLQTTIMMHVQDTTLPDPTARRLAFHRARVCVQALRELRDIYTSADYVYSAAAAAVHEAEARTDKVNSDVPAPAAPEPIRHPAKKLKPTRTLRGNNEKQEPLKSSNTIPKSASEQYQQEIQNLTPEVMGLCIISHFNMTPGERDLFTALSPPGSESLASEQSLDSRASSPASAEHVGDDTELSSGIRRKQIPEQDPSPSGYQESSGLRRSSLPPDEVDLEDDFDTWIWNVLPL